MGTRSPGLRTGVDFDIEVGYGGHAVTVAKQPLNLLLAKKPHYCGLRWPGSRTIEHISLSLSVFPRERRIGMKLLTLVLLTLLTAYAGVAAPLPPFQKHVLGDNYFCDDIAARHLNRDRNVDIVPGPDCYEAPDFN